MLTNSVFSSTLENTRITAQDVVPTPLELHEAYPLTSCVRQTVKQSRGDLEAILDRRDSRFMLVVGPCSIHDTRAALDYAERLKLLSQEVQDKLVVVMRVYFEKPRTTVGWKGLINDPELDESFNVAKGLCIARDLLCKINALGLPVGTEALDPITPQYLGDLVAWSAIGARTTESQTHREMASGLSSPVGFKNGTDGSVAVAVNAMKAAASGHSFLGMDFDGRIAVMKTTGNPYGHLILRGGAQPNYDEASVAQAVEQLAAAKVPQNIVIDCSHGNSSKQYARQMTVLEEVGRQRAAGQRALVGAMLESHLVAGAQTFAGGGRTQLTYGQSITDACLGWEDTRRAILSLCEAL